MSIPPKTLIKSRKNLQEICNNGPDRIKKYEFFDRVLITLWTDLKRLLLTPRIVYPSNISNHIINLQTPAFRDTIVLTETLITELIEVLKTEYPDVDFTYKETIGYNGNILERIIIMDWS